MHTEHGGRPSLLRLSAETILAGISVVLFTLTLLAPEWIEEITGLEPDNGSGALEVALPVAFAAAAVVFGWLARRDLNRRRAGVC